MTNYEIISAIDEKVRGTNYSDWTIGVTDKPFERKEEHESEGKDVSHWSHYNTDSEEVGRAVEKHFLDLGMKGGTGGGGHAGYVYVFKS